MQNSVEAANVKKKPNTTYSKQCAKYLPNKKSNNSAQYTNVTTNLTEHIQKSA